MENLWEALSWFWPSKSVQEWRVAATEPGHETTNMLIIGICPGHEWANARVALRPLRMSDGANNMQLQFFYLSHTQSDEEILEYKKPESPSGVADARGNAGFRWMESGDILHLRSIDHTRYPLPSFLLLELQWHLSRAMRAVATPGLLQILFDDSGYDDDAERENYKPRNYDPCAKHTPWFSHYLIDCALEQGIIGKKDVPLWKERLDPDGELRDEGEGWIYYRYGGWEYVVDRSTIEWEYVAGYDKDGNRVTECEEERLREAYLKY